MRPEYFFSFMMSFIVGVALESVLSYGYSLALLFTVLSVVVLLLGKVGSPSKSVVLVSLVLLGCAGGILRVDVSQKSETLKSTVIQVESVLELSGIIVDEPDVRENYTNIVLEANVLEPAGSRLGREIKSVKVLVRVPAYPEIHYGDEVSLVGKVTKPKNFAPDGNAKAFDYESYLAKDGIYYQMYFPKVIVVSHNNGNLIKEKLFALKAWLMRNISENIAEPESSLASGITLGAKQSLGDDLMQKFRETGVAHIVVLSGYNIAVVAGIISRLIIFMPFTLRLVTSALGIVLFAVMVGGGATVVRATVMALIIILARVLGREGDALRALVLAGGMMVLVNPMILLYDVSFQLSFSATLAIVVLVPVIEKYFLFITNRVLREIVVTTLATQIFVLPLILYHMGSVSLIGLVSNIFILPVVPLAMLVVALVAIFSWVPLLGNMFAFFAYALLAYIFIAVDFFARVPFASLHDISFSLAMMTILYIIIGIIIFRFRSQPRDY